MIYILLSIVAFAATAALGLYAARLICMGLPELQDAPPSGNPHVRLVIVAAAFLGALASARGLPPNTLGIFCLVCGVLAGIWYADIVRGIVPDLFTILPLVAIGFAAALTGRWSVLVSAAIPMVPFAIVAAVTKGRGLGWGDTKLAGLGGALLGMENAVLAFGLASLGAAVIGRFRADKNRPIAFAPYLVVGIAIPLALQAAR